MKKNIKEIFSIDLKHLLNNAVFLKDEIEDKKDAREFLTYSLDSKFLNVYDQMGIRIFEGEPAHIEFRTRINDAHRIKEVISRITKEYGPDQNNLTENDWNGEEHFAWWFKNEEHEQTVDDAYATDPNPIYYGIMIHPRFVEGNELVICDYMVLETETNKKLAKKLAKKS